MRAQNTQKMQLIIHAVTAVMPSALGMLLKIHLKSNILMGLLDNLLNQKRVDLASRHILLNQND